MDDSRGFGPCGRTLWQGLDCKTYCSNPFFFWGPFAVVNCVVAYYYMNNMPTHDEPFLRNSTNSQASAGIQILWTILRVLW